MCFPLQWNPIFKFRYTSSLFICLHTRKISFLKITKHKHQSIALMWYGQRRNGKKANRKYHYASFLLVLPLVLTIAQQNWFPPQNRETRLADSRWSWRLWAAAPGFWQLCQESPLLRAVFPSRLKSFPIPAFSLHRPHALATDPPARSVTQKRKKELLFTHWLPRIWLQTQQELRQHECLRQPFANRWD